MQGKTSVSWRMFFGAARGTASSSSGLNRRLTLNHYKPGYAVWLHRTNRLASAVKNALVFRKKLAPFTEHARNAGRRRRAGQRGCRPEAQRPGPCVGQRSRHCGHRPRPDPGQRLVPVSGRPTTLSQDKPSAAPQASIADHEAGVDTLPAVARRKLPKTCSRQVSPPRQDGHPDRAYSGLRQELAASAGACPDRLVTTPLHSRF